MTIPPTPTRSATRSPIRLEIRHQLGALESAWDALVHQQNLSSPFLASWWINHAAEGTPALLCCFAGSELVGGAAFQIDTVGPRPLAVKRVRCVGQGTLAPDHLDLIAQPDHAKEVLDLVLGWLQRSGSRIVDLDGLSATGALAQSLQAHEIERIAAPWTLLPSDSAEFLAARSGQVRSTISRTRKRFVREGVHLRRVPTDDMPSALDRLAELHDSRWSEESSFLDGWKRFRAAAIAGAASESVIIHELVSAEGDVIATELDLLCGNSLAFYQAGRRTEREWRGSGSVLRADILQWACSQGFAEYDLLRGDESYKADWSDSKREVVRCRMGVGPRGVALIQAARAQRRLRVGATRSESMAKKLLSRGPLKSRHEAHSEQSD